MRCRARARSARSRRHLDRRPVDVELAQQRAGHQHLVDIDQDPVIIPALDDALVDQADDQLVVAADQLDQVLVREAVVVTASRPWGEFKLRASSCFWNTTLSRGAVQAAA